MSRRTPAADQLVAELLRQRLGEPRDLLAREPGHEPVAPRRIDLIQREKRHSERHAVARRAGLVMVIERETASRHLQPVRKLHCRYPPRLLAHQVLALAEPELRLRAFR